MKEQHKQESTQQPVKLKKSVHFSSLDFFSPSSQQTQSSPLSNDDEEKAAKMRCWLFLCTLTLYQTLDSIKQTEQRHGIDKLLDSPLPQGELINLYRLCVDQSTPASENKLQLFTCASLRKMELISIAEKATWPDKNDTKKTEWHIGKLPLLAKEAWLDFIGKLTDCRPEKQPLQEQRNVYSFCLRLQQKKIKNGADCVLAISKIIQFDDHDLLQQISLPELSTKVYPFCYLELNNNDPPQPLTMKTVTLIASPNLQVSRMTDHTQTQANISQSALNPGANLPIGFISPKQMAGTIANYIKYLTSTAPQHEASLGMVITINEPPQASLDFKQGIEVLSEMGLAPWRIGQTASFYAKAGYTVCGESHFYKIQKQTGSPPLAWFERRLVTPQDRQYEQRNINQLCLQSFVVDSVYLAATDTETVSSKETKRQLAVTLIIFHHLVKHNQMSLEKTISALQKERENYILNQALTFLNEQKISDSISDTPISLLTRAYQQALTAYNALYRQLKIEPTAIPNPEKRFSLNNICRIQSYIKDTFGKSDLEIPPDFKLKLYQKLQGLIQRQQDQNQTFSLEGVVEIAIFSMSILANPALYEVRSLLPGDGKGAAVRGVEYVLAEAKEVIRKVVLNSIPGQTATGLWQKPKETIDTTPGEKNEAEDLRENLIL